MIAAIRWLTPAGSIALIFAVTSSGVPENDSLNESATTSGRNARRSAASTSPASRPSAISVPTIAPMLLPATASTV